MRPEHASFLGLRLLLVTLALFPALLQLWVGRVQFNALLVVFKCLFKAAQAVESHGTSLVALVPVALDFNAFFSVFEGLGELVQVVEAGGTVGVEGVVRGILKDRSGKVLNSLVKVLASEGFGA